MSEFVPVGGNRGGGSAALVGPGTRIGGLLPTQQATPALSQQQFDTLSLSIFNDVQGTNVGVGPWEHAARFTLGTAVDTIDSIWATPLNPFGERGDVVDSVFSGAQAQYYERNKDAIEGASAVVGGIATVAFAEALLIPKIAGALATSTALTSTRAWKFGANFNAESTRRMLEVQRAAVAEGGATSLMSSPGGARFLAEQFGRGAVIATRTLPFDYAVMWENEAFNSGDLGEELFWTAIGGTLGGTIIGAIPARALHRQAMNSDTIRRAIADQLPLAGITNELLNPSYATKAVYTPSQLNRARPGNQPDALLGADGVEATMYLIASRGAQPDGWNTPAPIAARNDSMRQQFQGKAIDSIKKILGRRIEGVNVTRVPVNSMPEIEDLVKNRAKEDPYIIFGVEELGLVEGNFADALIKRDKHIQKMFDEANQMAFSANDPKAKRLASKAARMKRQEGFVYAGGAWYDPRGPLAAALKSHNEEQVRGSIQIRGDILEMPTANGQGKIQLTGTMKLRVGNKSVRGQDLSIEDRLRVNTGIRRYIDHVKSGKGNFAVKIEDSIADNWMQLDAIDELLRAGGPNATSSKMVQFVPGGRLQSQADIQRQSLRAKAQQLLKEKGPTGRITAEDRLRYNLPAPTAMERLEDPAGDAFRVWLRGAAGQAGTVQEMHKALTSVRAAHGLDLLDSNKLGRVDGEMLAFNRNEQGRWMRPMLGFFEPRAHLPQVAQGMHAERLLAVKTESLAILRDAGRNTPISQAVDTLVESPEFARAHAVNELADAQSTGIGGKVSQLLGEFLPKRFLHRDNPTILAASRLAETMERAGRIAFEAAIEKFDMKKVIDSISSSGGAALRAELDQFATLRPGWSIKKPVKGSDGRWRFELEDDVANRRLLGVDSVKAGTMMPSLRTGEDLTLSEEAYGIVDRFSNGLMAEVRRGDNTVRASKGQQPIALKNLYMPAAATRNKFVGFVQGPDGKIVPGHAVIAETAEEYDRLSKAVIDELGQGNGYTIKTREQFAATRDIWDTEAIEWIDHGTSTAVARGTQAGGLTRHFVKDGAFMDALTWAKDRYAIQHNDALKVLLRDPLQVARMRSATERQLRGVSPGREGSGAKAATRNIFDEFEQAITGSSKAYRDTGIISRAVDATEQSIDNVLDPTARHVTELMRRLGATAPRIGAAATVSEINKQLGKYSPYHRAEDFIAARGLSEPVTVRRVAQGLNNFATNVILRWDPFAAHAAMNILGLIPTLMAGVRAGSAPATMALQVKGKNIPVWDGMAILKGALADMTARSRHADWQHMVVNGDASQSAFEYHRTISSLDSQAGWHKWAQNLDKWVAFTSDQSENLSRQMAHFTGLRIADYQGIKGLEARHSFAREFANSAIADYTPSNRPELWTTAFGSVFGLFQSYAMNQMTKMFHWMELKDYKAFGTQAAVQATMFGIPGTYGLGAIMDVHDKFFKDSGEPSLMDSMYQRFGPVLGGAFAHGSISEVTQIAFWTRGDISPRLPMANGMLPPGIDVLKRMAASITGGFQVFLAQQPEHMWPAMIENFQREMPNRVLKGALALANGGLETDRSGNVITESRDWFESLVRVAGYRSARQQRELETFFRGKSDMDRDAIRMERVREAYKAAARSALNRNERVNPNDFFDDYVAAGGMPQRFRSWVKQLTRDAVNPRAAADLRKDMANPRNRLNTWRYGATGAWEVGPEGGI